MMIERYITLTEGDMMKNFSVERETDSVEGSQFAGGQAARAALLGVTRVFVWRWIVGRERLPKYVSHAIQIAGYHPYILGGTTYRHSVVGLTPTGNQSVMNAIKRGARCITY